MDTLTDYTRYSVYVSEYECVNICDKRTSNSHTHSIAAIFFYCIPIHLYMREKVYSNTNTITNQYYFFEFEFDTFSFTNSPSSKCTSCVNETTSYQLVQIDLFFSLPTLSPDSLPPLLLILPPYSTMFILTSWSIEIY